MIVMITVGKVLIIISYLQEDLKFIKLVIKQRACKEPLINHNACRINSPLKSVVSS